MKTPLITREGYEKLKKEMDYLWREESGGHQKSDLGGKPGRP
jgi:hypothetical protein